MSKLNAIKHGSTGIKASTLIARHPALLHRTNLDSEEEHPR